MSRRRSEVQILAEILNISLNGVNVTRLMYQANLSYSTLRKYLSATIKKKLIEKLDNGDDGVKYCTTEKGKLFLRKLKEVAHVLRS
jgi:predicted transcriptional regulator